MSFTPNAVTTIDTARKVLSVVDRGLCCGLGEPIPGQMCVEAAVCYALGLPHHDDPKCVDPALRLFAITLNDSSWSSPMARAAGMRKLAVAQLGSLGQIDSIKFAQNLAERTIRRLLPPMLRQIGLREAADRCEREGTEEAAYAASHAAARYVAASRAAYAARAAAYVARHAVDAADAADAAADAAYAARHAADAARAAADADAGHATYAAAHAARHAADAAYAARHAASRDGVLMLMGDICIDTLREMGAPGIALMDQIC